MNEQTRNELSAKLEELKIREAQAWEAYKVSEKECEKAEDQLENPLRAAKEAKEAKNKEWLMLNKAYDGLRVLLSMEEE